jgi:cell division protease FtsH
MSDRMGLTAFERPRNPFLQGEQWMPTEKEYSEKTAAEIDDEVRRILDETHTKTRRIIEEKRDIVDRLANLLLEKEVVGREEFKALMHQPA